MIRRYCFKSLTLIFIINLRKQEIETLSKLRNANLDCFFPQYFPEYILKELKYLKSLMTNNIYDICIILHAGTYIHVRLKQKCVLSHHTHSRFN